MRLIAEERVHLEKLVQAAIDNSGADEQGGKIRRFLGQATDDSANSTEGLIGLFRQVIRGIYRDEASAPKGRPRDPMVLENRLRALHAFEPHRANLPSPEEAQAQSDDKTAPDNKRPPRDKAALAA